VLAAGVIVLAAVVVALSLTFGSDAPAARLPAPLPGAQVLGSALPGGQIETVACGGGRPNGGSPACTIVQMRLPGRSVTAGANGAVLRWAVRGASGQLAVQVLRRQRDRFVEVSRSAYERADGPGLHVFRTALPIQAGDMVGLLVQSGAAIGVRRATVAGATTDRWLGPLGVVSRTADRGPGTGLDRELLLRVEYVPGASARLPGLLTGPRAASAPAGRRLGALPVELPDRRLATVAVVRLSAGIAIDLLRAGRRIARAPVADVNANGNLASLTVFGGRVPQLDWRNPDGTVVHHDYEVGVNTLAPHDRQ
jgi:hypothetical protein